MLENLAKKSHFYNILSEARYFHLHLEWNAQKESILASFWEPEACGQTVLPDRLLLIGQKLVKNAKIRMRHFWWFSNNFWAKKEGKNQNFRNFKNETFLAIFKHCVQ